jgi:hypothetical protein
MSLPAGDPRLSKGKRAARLALHRTLPSGVSRPVPDVKQKAANKVNWEDIGQEAPEPRNNRSHLEVSK